MPASGFAGWLDKGRVVGVRERSEQMIILGIVLLVIGAIANIGILWVIGAILVVLGLIFWILGAMGRAVGGRPHYY
jgi:uncharacterized protein DUF6131